MLKLVSAYALPCIFFFDNLAFWWHCRWEMICVLGFSVYVHMCILAHNR